MGHIAIEALQYKHPAVIRRFQKDFPQLADRAEQIFSDLMLFFYLSKRHEAERRAQPQKAELDFVFIMDDEMKEIDLMWHVFLLYTADYMNFCETHFGEYLHHLPDVVPALELGRFDAETNLRRFLNYVVDASGEAVLERWFRESTAA